MTDSMQQSSS